MTTLPNALEGDDTITGAGGDDTIDGGPGSDTAIYSGGWVNYSITETGPFTLTDTRLASPDGTDTISNVENFFNFLTVPFPPRKF